jgi:glycine hydroxymethyltransferase
MFNKFTEIFVDHNNLRSSSLNLLPSESVMSPLAKKFLSSDMGQRYFFVNSFRSEGGYSYNYSGTKYIEEMLFLGEKIANEVFNSFECSLFPLSGHQANIAILLAYCKAGDNIMVYDTKYGGYPGLDSSKLPKHLGLNTYYLPVQENIPEKIDLSRSLEQILTIKPRMIILSLAHTLFPFELQSISEVAHSVGSIVVYDGSHPLGLIAGGQFQSPLLEGADFLLGGTQKSFPGPQGGIILSRIGFEKIREVEQFVMVDNPHYNRIAATAVTLWEMKIFGRDYAEQVIKNTKKLALHLWEAGLPILYPELGFTESHMFKIKFGTDYEKFVKSIEKANIIIDSAGRVGTAEMTRFGMKEDDMSIIAEFIIKAWFGENPEHLSKQVIDFRSSFSNVYYCQQSE